MTAKSSGLVCVCLRACPAGGWRRGAGCPISIFLPFPLSPYWFLLGYLFIAPAGCRPPAAGLEIQPWGMEHSKFSTLSPSPIPLCFPKPQALRGMKELAFWHCAMEGSLHGEDGTSPRKGSLAGAWVGGSGFGLAGLSCSARSLCRTRKAAWPSAPPRWRCPQLILAPDKLDTVGGQSHCVCHCM